MPNRSDSPGAPMRARLRSSLIDAMKNRDEAAVSALRSTLAAIDNAEAVDPAHAPRAGGTEIAGAVSGLGAAEVPRLHLSESNIAAIVRREIVQRLEAAGEHDGLALADRAARLRAEAAVLEAHLHEP